MYAGEIRNIYHAKSLLNIHAGRNGPRVLALCLCSKFPIPLIFAYFCIPISSFFIPTTFEVFFNHNKNVPSPPVRKMYFHPSLGKILFFFKNISNEKKSCPTNHLSLTGSSYGLTALKSLKVTIGLLWMN